MNAQETNLDSALEDSYAAEIKAGVELANQMGEVMNGHNTRSAGVALGLLLISLNRFDPDSVRATLSSVEAAVSTEDSELPLPTETVH